MFEIILIAVLSLCVMLLVNHNLKLKGELNQYKFEKFMGEINNELTSSTKQDYTIIERILQ
jgi:hypothetical protein